MLPWTLGVCLQVYILAERRYPSTSKPFPGTSPVRPSARDATTLESCLDSTSRTIPDQDPLSTSSACTFNIPRDPAPAYVSRLAGQGHAAAFLGGLLTNSSLPQNTLYSLPVPVLNQLIPSHSSSLSFNVTSRETPLSWASLLMLGSLIYALKVHSMFQNSYKNTCQDGCRT